MPAFHIVVKLLMLRLLLASLSGLSAYEFGYHPSAEEFDSLLRNTRTWTRDLLASERRRAPFLPKYNSQPPVAAAAATASLAQKIDRLPSSLHFQMFSDEQPLEEPESSQPVQSQLLEINAPSPASTSISTSTSSVISTMSTSKPLHKAQAFPIFFTNPVTGITYAITEVGHADRQALKHYNGSNIPIYITKAQYDNDLLALRQRYEAVSVNCQATKLSTAKPHIVHLPTAAQTTGTPSELPLASNKLPPVRAPQRRKPAAAPAAVPLVVGAAGQRQPAKGTTTGTPLTTATTTRTTRAPTPTRRIKTKRKKTKRKKKKTQRRPGRRPLGAAKPAAAAGPQIVRGKPHQQQLTVSTASTVASSQLEKPHMPLATSSTIFSSQPAALKGKKQRLRRRSLADKASQLKTAAEEAKPAETNDIERKPDKSKMTGDKIKAKKKKRRGSEEGFDLLELIADDDDDDDDDDGEGEEGDYNENNSIYYDYDEYAEAGHKQSAGDSLASSLSRFPDDATLENSSSAEEGADFGAMEEQQSTVAGTGTASVEDKIDELEMSTTKNSMGKKRIRRRPPGEANYGAAGSDSEEYDDEDEASDDDDEESESGIGGFLRMIFYPMQLAMSRIFDGFTGQTSAASEEETPVNKPQLSKPLYPTYTLYHSKGGSSSSNEQVFGDEEDEADESSGTLSSWIGSWFGFAPQRRHHKKIGSTTVMPTAQPAPTEEPSWLESWLGYGKATETPASASHNDDDDDGSKWFFGWFDSKPKTKARRRTTTSTTTTTTPTPQVPILTIVDPLRNPQNWIGILAHHIANSTSTTTHNPLIHALTRVTNPSATSTTTEQPEIPRRISYEKYQIWRLKPQDEVQVRMLEEFKKGEEGIKLHWLKGPSLRGLTDVLVPPKMLVDFQGTLNFEGIAHEVLIFDVGKAIAYEQTKEDYLFTTPTHSKRPTKPGQGSAPMTWNKYYAYDDILKYLETIRMRHAQLVELIHIGRSYEGRPLVIVKIESKQMAAAASAAAVQSHKRLKYKRKSGQANAVFIEAGSHGLAWIGPASATWMINELLRLMRTNKTDADFDFIRNTTWYIMPVLNPDGYAYSHEFDRFWKKSRSRHVAKPQSGILNSAMTWLQQKRNSEKICFGVDLDRNWLYHWGKRGSSKMPCNEFYAGPTPFSEPETKAVSEFLMEYRTQIKLYISLQAYGQIVSYPVKANSTFNTERMDDFLDVAMVGTDGLRKKGSKSRYKVDSANDLIEHRSGCADAFAAYEIGIPFSYTLQLADNGVHGYLLPSSSIEPTARDAFEIITGMLDYI